MADLTVDTTKPQVGAGDETSMLQQIAEVLHRNGGTVGLRQCDSSNPLSGVDCLQFVASGDGCTIATITATNVKEGTFVGFALGAGQPLPVEFTAISLSDGSGFAIDRAGP